MQTEWKPFVKRLATRKSFDNYALGCKIVKKLGYPSFYSPITTILDVYGGVSLFSAALHNEIKPAKHILMEPFLAYRELMTHLQAGDPEKIVHEREDPFRWSTFSNQIQSGIYTPETVPRQQVHDSLLFTANLLHPQGEQLATQYINCISNHSWIQRYGRVRLLLWLKSSTAEKLVAGPGDRFRHRVSCQTESCCDIRVVLHTMPAKERDNYPQRLKEPLVPEFDTKRDILSPSKLDASLIELTPKAEQVEHIDEFEYVIKMLFVLKSQPLNVALNSLGPGATEDLSPQLQDMLHLKPTELTLEQLLRVTEVFWRWPFKPEGLLDFYDDSSLGAGGPEYTRD